jgi:Glycosyl transferase family 11
MLKIVKFHGGLGNQMFAFAFLLAIKQKHFSIVNFDPLNSWFSHNGYELFKVFDNIKLRRYKFYRRQYKIYSLYFTRFLFNTVQENSQMAGSFDESYLKTQYGFVVYDGFWQSELYFKSISDTIRKNYIFDTKKLNMKSQKLLTLLSSTTSVSIHIRRGDYLEHTENFGDICNTEYYNNAVNIIRNEYNDVIFFIFSDDANWVKQNIDIMNAVFVDWNEGNDSWQDMCLMSKCKHNIIANSTFSWWGAWLNANPNKTVIAPNKWMNNKECIDVLPLEWTKI